MSEVPKIVLVRLRAADLQPTAERAHPEADVLAAFAEQGLSQIEREGVLSHLAQCVDCRQAVQLALPAMAVTPPSVEVESDPIAVERAQKPVSPASPRNWFVWANLRWAVLTAGVAVAVFSVQAGLEYRGKLKAPETIANHFGAQSTQSSVPAQITSDLARPQSLENYAKEVGTKRRALSGHNASAAGPVAGRQPGKFLAGNRTTGSPFGNQPAPYPGVAAPDVSTSGNEEVEASGTATSGEIGVASGDLDLMAKAQSPSQVPSIEKAKPALDESSQDKGAPAGAHPPVASATNQMAARGLLASAPTLKQGMAWMVESGVLKRSSDGGRTWQATLTGEGTWLCYATRGQQVWVGGTAGAIKQSSDGGQTWTAIAVISRGQTLSSDVVGIDLKEPAEIVLATASHETWSSANGGRTWEKH